jgi:glycosyltransferase involved in cell wall biosynthesis
MKPLPRISIVTPSFNQADFIEEALASVKAQNYPDYEHLVMDGLSNDGTVELLQRATFDSVQAQLFWVSELDAGQSEAMNKGFKRATGDIVGWLNSDDRYRPGCFERVVQTFEDNPQVDIVYGDYLTVKEDGTPVQIRREIEFSPFILLYHRVLYIPTTTTFIRRRIFEEGNYLDETLQYAMDLDFFLRLAARGYRFKHIPHILADFRLQPKSKTCTSPDRQHQEHQQIINSMAPSLRYLRSPYLKKTVLAFLRILAAGKRYSEKMFKGYYWEQLRDTADRSRT